MKLFDHPCRNTEICPPWKSCLECEWRVCVSSTNALVFPFISIPRPTDKKKVIWFITWEQAQTTGSTNNLTTPSLLRYHFLSSLRERWTRRSMTFDMQRHRKTFYLLTSIQVNEDVRRASMSASSYQSHVYIHIKFYPMTTCDLSPITVNSAV